MADTPFQAAGNRLTMPGDRVWPLLLRAGAMSIHPGRVLIGMLTFLILIGVGESFDATRRWINDDSPALFEQVMAIWRAIIHGVIPSGWPEPGMPRRDAAFVPADMPPLVLWVLLSAAASVGLGAMARMVAVDIAADADMSVRHAIRFALARWMSFILACALPVVLILGVLAAIGLAGMLLLSAPWLSMLGAVLFGLAIIAGVAAAALWLALLIGGGMLAPAVACESTDAIDAIQRCVAYVYKRFGHALLYLLILTGVWFVAMFAIRFVVLGGLTLAESASSMWLSAERGDQLFHSVPGESVTTSVIGAWRWIIDLLVGGWTLSYAATGGTLMYLALRRVCDDQDPRDLWMEAGRFTPVMPVAADAGEESADQDDFS